MNKIVQKVSVSFSKTGPVRFISHRDLMRTIAHALRRAGDTRLPIRFTEGFNPRPRVVLPEPLEVGVASLAETVEVELSKWIPLQKLRAMLSDSFSQARLTILDVTLLPPTRKGRKVTEAEYEVAPPHGAAEVTEEAVEDFLRRDRIVVTRTTKGETKETDIRPGILEAHASGGKLHVRLSRLSATLVRVADVASAFFGCDPRALRIVKRWARIVPA